MVFIEKKLFSSENRHINNALHLKKDRFFLKIVCNYFFRKYEYINRMVISQHGQGGEHGECVSKRNKVSNCQK